MQLSLLVSPFTNRLDHIKSENLLVGLSTNPDRTESKSLLIGLLTNPNCIKSKSFSDNCCKNNGTKSKRIGGEEVKKDNSESPK